ncbi:MAG: hypothetical protein NTZ67_05525 [Gammaproteobacteria bacterium]|nr:hypothetical protein [Gammaproteobacteria bacterium]
MNRLCLTGLLFYCASSLAQFSNMIVFGDSLSDGGNFPESQKILWDANKGKTLANSVPQLYVPFSNPIDTASPPFSFTWPTLSDAILDTQVTIDNTNRKYRSISWPQFFLNMAALSHLSNSSAISPSNLLNFQKIPNTTSFNYAWGYAMTSESCVNPYYQPTQECDAKRIYQARKNYLVNPSMENYKKIEVPGLYKQLELFVNDERSNKVAVDQNTLYVFWISANDLIVASDALLSHWNPFPILKFILGFSSENILKNISILHYSLPKKKQPKAVYVFNMFNPKLTPGYYNNTTLGTLGGVVVDCHNFWLKWNAKIFNLFSSTKVIILPAHKWYERSSKTDYFKLHLGQACQLDGGDYTSPTTIPKSNCAGFMFWNAVHPAAPMNALEAYQFFNVLISDKTARKE